MNILLIHSVDSLLSKNPPLPGGLEEAFAFDVSGSLSTEKRSEIEAYFESQGTGIVEWMDGYLGEKDEQLFRDELLDWLATMPEKLRCDGRNVKELFTFRNRASLWWMTRLSQKKSSKTPVYQLTRVIYRIARLVERIREKTSAKLSFFVISDDRAVRRILPDALQRASPRNEAPPRICTWANAGCHRQGGKPEKRDLVSKSGMASFFGRLRRSYEHIVSTNLFLSQLRSKQDETSKGPLKRVVLVATNRKDFEAADSANGEMRWRNLYFGDLDRKLAERGFEPTWICLSGNRPMGEADYRESLKSITNDYHALFPGWAVVFRLFVENLKWVYGFIKAFLVARIHKACSYRGVNVGFLLAEDFKNLCSGHGAVLFYYQSLFESAFRKLRPRAVIYRKEFSSIGRAITSAVVPGCKMIAVQHGIVNNSQIGYLYRANEIDNRDAVETDFVKHCPVPDHVVVWGNRMVEYMSGAGFPQHKLLPFGSVRHDTVVRKYMEKDNEGAGKKPDLLKKHRRALAIDGEKLVVLLCTQWGEVASDWFELMAGAIQLTGIDCSLIVKPHPHYPETTRLIEERAQRIGFADYRMVTSGFYELVFCSDVMVSHSSSAILDAVLLKTPVILIHQEGLQNDNSLFRNDGIGAVVRNSEEMASALSSFHGKKMNTDEWEKQRRRFLDHHLVNPGAGTESSLIDFIESG